MWAMKRLIPTWYLEDATEVASCSALVSLTTGDGLKEEPKKLTGANSDSMIPHESSKGMTLLIHRNSVSFLHELLLDNDELIHIS